MTVLARVRNRLLAPKLAQYSGFYENEASFIDDVQLQSLNAGWRDSLKRSPWARALRQCLNAPAEFRDWDEFNSTVSVQRKTDLMKLISSIDIVNSERNILWRSTGGTTAEPIRLPIFRSETDIASLDLWLGRQRLGISPKDKLFLLWGHGHLFGTGLNGRIARIRRSLSDWMLGYTRWSAYRLSPDELRLAAEALVSSGASYVLGYSAALDQFARVNSEKASIVRRLGLRAVIATAEGFPTEDSREMLSEFFGCPVVMEYGAVETGPMAYERAAGAYDVFWAHHRFEQVPLADSDSGKELVVTCLFPRAIPLLRYAVGDMLETSSGDTDYRRSFTAVIGRCNDIVTTASGKSIHSEAFSHVVRDIKGIEVYQIVRNKQNRVIRLKYVSQQTLAVDVVLEIHRRLALVDAQLENLPLERVDSIDKSVAGKSVMVVEEG